MDNMIQLKQFFNWQKCAIRTTSSFTANPKLTDRKTEYYQKIGTGGGGSQKRPEDWDRARPFCEIPGPKPLPVIGNVGRYLLPGGKYFKLDFKQIHEKLQQEYGDIVLFNGLPGVRDIVLVFNPAYSEKVFRNEGVWPVRTGLPSFTYYRTVTRKDVFQGVGGVLALQGEEWFKFRSVVNPIIMRPRTVAQYVGSMDQIARELIENLRYLAGQSDQHEMPPDFINYLHKWALESIAFVTLDTNLGCLKRDLSPESEAQKIINAVLEMFHLMYKLDVMPSLWRHISTPTWRKYVRTLDFLTETILKYIQEAMERFDPSVPDHEQSVLQKLLTQDRKIALSMATDMMTAGIDTTGRTMAAALYYLARHPDKQQNLHNEAKAHLPDPEGPITKEILERSPYLRAVIKETTRLAPIAIGNLRTTVQDLVLGGYQIPKGTEILSSNLVMCGMEGHFLRANQFLPERWLRTTEGPISFKNTNPFVHMPFGFGPRSCIGRRIANLELEVALLRICRNFHLEWIYEDMVFKTLVLHGIDRPLKLRIHPVQDTGK